MLKYNFYVGLNDKYTWMIDCKGVCKMENTGKIVYENTIKIEIVSDSAIPADRIVEEIKNRLNQESVEM